MPFNIMTYRNVVYKCSLYTHADLKDCAWAVPQTFCMFDFYVVKSQASASQPGTEKQLNCRSEWMQAASGRRETRCLLRITDEASVRVAMV